MHSVFRHWLVAVYTCIIKGVKLSKINNLLLVLIILVNGYVIVAPAVPALIFGWQNHQGKQRQLTRAIHPAKTNQPQPNHIIIPSMLLNQPILEGSIAQQYKVLNNGIWRFPHSSTPDKGGNTVLIGHRFTYTNPRGIFYFLNKVKVNDEIGVWWNNKEYSYKVVTVAEVRPTDTAIEANTTNPELTLFTCTPLWLPKDRLVIVAGLETKP